MLASPLPSSLPHTAGNILNTELAAVLAGNGHSQKLHSLFEGKGRWFGVLGSAVGSWFTSHVHEGNPCACVHNTSKTKLF